MDGWLMDGCKGVWEKKEEMIWDGINDTDVEGCRWCPGSIKSLRVMSNKDNNTNLRYDKERGGQQPAQVHTPTSTEDT